MEWDEGITFWSVIGLIVMGVSALAMVSLVAWMFTW